MKSEYLSEPLNVNYGCAKLRTVRAILEKLYSLFNIMVRFLLLTHSVMLQISFAKNYLESFLF